ncbi:MAG TPA: hypothetical protein PKO25_01945 [Spirochaetota bacterium]|nr:hypothetical protein [Spirochaetota bacterium]
MVTAHIEKRSGRARGRWINALIAVSLACVPGTTGCSDEPKDTITLNIVLTDNGAAPNSFSGWYRINGGATSVIDGANIVYLGSNIYEFTAESDELDTLYVSVSRQDFNDTLEIMVYRKSTKVKEDRLSSGAAGNDLQLEYNYGEEDSSDENGG